MYQQSDGNARDCLHAKSKKKKDPISGHNYNVHALSNTVNAGLDMADRVIHLCI